MRVSRQRAREEEAALAAATAASMSSTPNGRSTRTSASHTTPSAAPTKTEKPEEKSTLQRLRDMWEFASLMQYIFMFGKVVKIDESFDIEDLETECVKPGPSAKLAEIGLCFLKFVSSHRGLTPELFDEYTRRQYVAKAPARNPFGTEEEPLHFNEFDIFTKIRVLHQLSTWTFHNPDRMRERMEEQTERDQTAWRCEELGYDADDRQYYVFDDNRLYRRTEPPIPAAPRAKPKANSKKAKAAARAAKRRKLSMNSEAEAQDEEQDEDSVKPDDGTDGGYKWECLAITLQEYQDFLVTLSKTKDPNEKVLRDSLIEDVMPIIEKLAEKQERKIREKERELINLQKMASAKRSSRLAGKQERERQEQEAAEAEAKRLAELKEAQKAEANQKKLEQERQNRMQTREQRIKEREHKRILHEEELRKLAEEKERLDSGEGRVSERRLKTELEKKKRDLEELDDEEEDWVFDCAGCGMHGQNIDDGQHSLACERCNVWQHSKCLGIAQAEAEKDDFHFVCRDCKLREEDAAKAKAAALKIRLKPSVSPAQPSTAGSPLKKDSPSESKKRRISEDTDEARKRAKATNAKFVEVAVSKPGNVMNGPMLPPQGVFQINGYGHSPLKQSPSPAQNGHSHSQTSTSTPGFHHQHNGLNGQANGRREGSYSASNAAATPAQKGPSSSPIMHAAASPIQNRPPMSPTQGNHDVGPLAGFPPSASMHHPYGAGSFNSPLQQAQMTPSNHQNRISKEEAPTSSFQSPYSSFSASTPSNSHSRNNGTTSTPAPGTNILNTPKHLHAMPLSGLSPTKHSPPRPSTSGSATGTHSNGNGTPAPVSIMPPQYNLQPSPKVESKKVEGLSPRKSPTPQEKKDVVMGDAPIGQELENVNVNGKSEL